MGAAEDARAGAAVYGDQTDQAVEELRAMVRKVEQAIALISGDGTLGESRHQELMNTRAFLLMARQNATAAGDTAVKSRRPLRTFIARAFPP